MPRFKRGQRVVCVDVTRADGKPHQRLKLGAVYTIREPNAPWPFGAERLGPPRPPWVKLMEVYRPVYDSPYAEFRFEPLEPKRQSIEEFRKLLTPRVREDA
jgi:hypothetical protein